MVVSMLLTEMGMAKVHLLAHSMGSRLVIYGLLRLHAQQLPQGAAKLGRVRGERAAHPTSHQIQIVDGNWGMVFAACACSARLRHGRVHAPRQ